MVFFIVRSRSTLFSKCWLILCSLFFYTWWNPPYLLLFLASILVNYTCSLFLLDKSFKHKKPVLFAGVLFNVLLISYYKYADFLINTGNQVFSADIANLDIILPLAISFFTFQQIAYLQDCCQEKVEGTGFVDYLLFISFFPQLIAGPIVQFKEIVPQFHSDSFKKMNWDNISSGLMLIAFGLFKKVIIADYFSIWANHGFAVADSLGFIKAWITSLSYSFQLYFDFSGYTDMALGAGLLFGITLPQNFNSPYKSLSIQDFWRRWHITLGRFLRDYLYIPLGGNRGGGARTLFNLFLVFFIAGIWHGAGWTFILWGVLHGTALVMHRIWDAMHFKMPKPLAWLTTFLFVNFAWVLFRASSISEAFNIITTMLSPDLYFEKNFVPPVASIMLGLIICLFVKNTNQIVEERADTRPLAVVVASLAAFAGLVTIKIWNAHEFLYFQF